MQTKTRLSCIGLLGLLSMGVVCLPSCSRPVEEQPNNPSAVTPSSELIEVQSDGRVRVTKAGLSKSWVLTFIDLKQGSTNFEDIRVHKSRVVAFHDSGDGKWTLRELPAVGAKPSPSDALIATFDATPSDDGILVSFDQGLRELISEFAVYSWWKPPPRVAIPIVASKVTETRQEKNAVFVRRDVEVDYPSAEGKTSRVPLHLYASFQPYEAPGDFKGKPNTAVGGYYVNVPVQAGNDKVTYAHRHDETAPIVYRVTAETPKERLGDIEVSAGYWNDVFSRVGVATRIKIEVLPPQTNPLLTTSHTIELAKEGLGRAVNQTDPFTGRITKSNVYAGAAFADQGAHVLGVRWSRLLADAGKPITKAPDALVARAVSDYYIHTWTHEIGHGLGLRHNFVGNLGSPLDAVAWNKAFDTYVNGDLPAGAVFTTSVMEYLPSEYSMLVGAHIRHKRGPLAYDESAIRAVYGKEAPPKNESRLYCEAEAAETFADCVEFDIGNHAILGSHQQVVDFISDKAMEIALAVQGGAAFPDGTVGQANAAADAKIVSQQLAEMMGHTLKQLVIDANFVSLSSKLPAEPSEAELTAYKAEVRALQIAAPAAMSGPTGELVRALVEKKPLDAPTSAMFASFKERIDTYLARSSASVPKEKVDAFVKSVQAELTPVLQEAAKLPYTCESCSE